MLHVFAALAIVAGLLLTGFGALEMFAGGMSDAPAAGVDAEQGGGKMLASGAALVVVGVVALYIGGRL